MKVETLGAARIPSPLGLSRTRGDRMVNYIPERARVLLQVNLDPEEKCEGEPESLEKAGPREKLFFDPARVTAGIVTCGGLCPGLNNVIRGLTLELYLRYGVRRVIGFRYGYAGLVPEAGHPPRELTPESVDDIFAAGGTILGTSRGRQKVETMVDTLARLGVDILFCIGGDGTLRGAWEIHREIRRRGLQIGIAGIPKTIDNDIDLLDRSFGFETAFSVSSHILSAAHSEAISHYNGIALVKLMGRDSGFIAASAALAFPSVNFVLIPELDFSLDGPQGFLSVLRRRLEAKHHALIVVSEGAGQNLFPGGRLQPDSSGNTPYHDIGLHLKDRISRHCRENGMSFTVKYIDPSYIIRSVPAIPDDAKFSTILAQYAVHGAMAGKTGFVIGRLHQEYVNIPIPLAIRQRKRIDLESQLWLDVLQATGQPVFLGHTEPSPKEPQ